MQLNRLNRFMREHAIKQCGLSAPAAQVARSAGFGEAIIHQREAKAGKRAKAKAGRAARRRNR